MSTLTKTRSAEAIVGRAGRLRPDSARRWGGMTPHQMLCHLSDAFRVALGERPSVFTGDWRTRLIIKNIALHTPVPWPKGYPAPPEIRQESGGTPPAEFEGDRQDLLRLIERFRAAPSAFRFPPHPTFGRLSWREWMIWGYRHSDHHLRQFGC